jgi:short-subunit dehydrogenase
VLSAEYLHHNIHTTSPFLSWVATPMMQATDKYAKMAEEGDAMTPERAAEWIMDGIATRKRKLYPRHAARRFAFNVLFPKFMTRSLSYVFRVYHDDREQFAEFEPDRKLLKRWVKNDPV